MATSKSSKATNTDKAAETDADATEQTPEAETREALATSESADQPTSEGAAKNTSGAEADVEKANAEVQAQVDREEERGLRGVEVDPTPNEHYTVAGVTKGLPTPETDADAHDAAHAAASPRNPHRTL